MEEYTNYILGISSSDINITHRVLVTPYGIKQCIILLSLVQVMAYHFLSAKLLPQPMLI